MVLPGDDIIRNPKEYPRQGNRHCFGSLTPRLMGYITSNSYACLSLFSDCSLPNYLSKNGKMFAVGPDGDTQTLAIKGVNWFGMET